LKATFQRLTKDTCIGTTAAVKQLRLIVKTEKESKTKKKTSLHQRALLVAELKTGVASRRLPSSTNSYEKLLPYK
jgi:hypothetical protein